MIEIFKNKFSILNKYKVINILDCDDIKHYKESWNVGYHSITEFKHSVIDLSKEYKNNKNKDWNGKAFFIMNELAEKNIDSESIKHTYIIYVDFKNKYVYCLDSAPKNQKQRLILFPQLIKGFKVIGNTKHQQYDNDSCPVISLYNIIKLVEIDNKIVANENMTKLDQYLKNIKFEDDYNLSYNDKSDDDDYESDSDDDDSSDMEEEDTDESFKDNGFPEELLKHNQLISVVEDITNLKREDIKKDLSTYTAGLRYNPELKKDENSIIKFNRLLWYYRLYIDACHNSNKEDLEFPIMQ